MLTSQNKEGKQMFLICLLIQGSLFIAWLSSYFYNAAENLSGKKFEAI